MRHHLRVADARRSTHSVEINDDARRVLRNTWNLLAMTLLFSAGVAWLSMANNWPHPGLLITLAGYFGLLFLTQALRNSAWGILSTFALTGFMGLTIGPIINAYTTVFSNGDQLVIAALGTTGVAFVGLSGFAMVTKRDFGFIGPMLFMGILVAFVAGLIAVFFNIPALRLAVSAMFAVLMCGVILYETQQIVRGGETNYIMATVTLFVSLYNLLLSLLRLMACVVGEEEELPAAADCLQPRKGGVIRLAVAKLAWLRRLARRFSLANRQDWLKARFCWRKIRQVKGRFAPLASQADGRVTFVWETKVTKNS